MKVEVLHITCPYCLVGHADVPCKITRDSTEVPGMKEAHKCNMCGQYMALIPKIDIRGITLEKAKEMGRHVA